MNKLELNMASTGQGSSFALIDQVFKSVGKKVLFISLELNGENIAKRIAIASEIKGVSMEEIDITIVECYSGATWDKVKSEIDNHDHDILIIDKIELIPSYKKSESIAENVNNIKEVFGQILNLKTPVLTTKMLSRTFSKPGECPNYSDLYKNMEQFLTSDQIKRINPYFVRKEGRKVMKENLRTSDKTEVIDLDLYGEIYKNKFEQ